MPLTVTWDDPEHTIIFVWGYDTWTWDDWYCALDEMIEMVRSTARQVDFIYASVPGTHVPKVQSISHYQHALHLMPENAGMHMIVNDKLFARTIMLLFFKSQGEGLRGQFQIVPTLAAARARIHQHRQQTRCAFIQ